MLTGVHDVVSIPPCRCRSSLCLQNCRSVLTVTRKPKGTALLESPTMSFYLSTALLQTLSRSKCKWFSVQRCAACQLLYEPQRRSLIDILRRKNQYYCTTTPREAHTKENLCTNSTTTALQCIYSCLSIHITHLPAAALAPASNPSSMSPPML